MAEPIYDQDKDLDNLTSEELHKLEREYNTPKDQQEDQAVEEGADPDSLPRQGMGRRLRERSQANDEEKAAAFKERLQDRLQAAQAQDTAAGRSLYNPGLGKPSRSRFVFLWRQRRNLLIGTGVMTILIITMVSLFGFLSVFKLDGLMSNIDAKSFGRFNGTLNSRSISYIQTYMVLRLADIGDNATNIDTDNLIFRSNKVSTGNPIHDWYATLKASKFEEEVFNKNGIKFASIAYREGDQIKLRPAKIIFNGIDKFGDPIPPNKIVEITALINAGDWSKVNMDDFTSKYLHLSEFFDSDKAGRKAIKQVVDDNTHFFQVVKRRHVRKAIQNMTGVQSWRFFEDTRTKVSEQKVAIRNKIIAAMVPQSTTSGKFINCLFGISACEFYQDPENPTNHADTSLIGDPNILPNQPLDAQGEPIPGQAAADYGPARDVIDQILGKAVATFNVANIVSLMDSLDSLNTALRNQSLSKGVAAARTAQAIGLYQVLATARDQVKSGNVNAAEFSQFMQVMGPISNNEGWDTVISSKPSSSVSPAATGGRVFAAEVNDPTNKDFYCSPAHQKVLHDNLTQANKEYTFRCPDKQIGASSNAKAIEDGWDKTLGTAVGPILDTYHKARHAKFIGGALDFVTKIIGDVTSVIVQGALSVLGLGDDIKKVTIYIMGQAMGFLGAGPMINCTNLETCGNAPAGDYINLAIQGGAAAAEASARNNGASLTNDQSKAVAQQNLAIYQTQQNSSFKSRFLSLDNPNSLSGRAVFALSNISFDNIRTKLNFGNLLNSTASVFASLFSSPALAAAADNGYTAANFAGIQTFDYPQECMDFNPLSTDPLEGTNIMKIFAKHNIAVNSADQQSLNSWATQSNSAAFYQTLYKVIGDRDNSDEIAEAIYNCNLLDNTVRSGLGYTYGYSQDYGLEDNSTTQIAAPSTPGAYQNPLRDISNLTAMRIDQGVDYGGAGPIYPIGSAKIDSFSYPDAGWLNGIFVSYTLTDGRAVGRSVFVAENCIPTQVWKVGDSIGPNTILCTLVDSPPHMEIGWAPGGQAIALAKSIYVQGDATALGRNFSDLMQKLGAPGGTYDHPSQRDHETGELPLDWPTWQ